MAGVAGNTNLYDPPPKPPPSTSLFGNPATFTAAANKQASDYDTIMASYANIAANANPITSTPISSTQVGTPQPVSSPTIAPQTAQYSQSPDVTSGLSKLSDLATTGGYTDQGIQDLRARGVSPTRSIYANAQQNVERQRALGGGYSPNFNATQAQLARDESSQISDINTNVNAGIAQNVAANKIAAAPAYASASATANAAKTQADQNNAAIINQINEANAQRATQTGEFNTSTAAAIAEANANRATQTGEFNSQLGFNTSMANRQNALLGTQGMQSLYGTTPALTNTFGNQVTQAAQLGQNQQGIDQRNLGLITGYTGVRG